MTARLPYRNVDMEAVACVDVGHHWKVTDYGRLRRDGLLRGAAARHVECITCHSTRTDVIGNHGQVISRWYDHDPAYIDGARAFGDYNERRQHLRAEAARRERNAPWWD